MEALTEGTRLLYVLSEQEAASINEYIANHPDQHRAGAHVEAGQRVPASVVRSRGPGGTGEERLAVLLDGATPPEKGYHVWAADLHYADGAWQQPADKASRTD
jgi:hypothetical protein